MPQNNRNWKGCPVVCQGLPVFVLKMTPFVQKHRLGKNIRCVYWYEVKFSSRYSNILLTHWKADGIGHGSVQLLHVWLPWRVGSQPCKCRTKPTKLYFCMVAKKQMLQRLSSKVLTNALRIDVVYMVLGCTSLRANGMHGSLQPISLFSSIQVWQT